jgi:pre-mRNA-processing factor 40
MKMLKRSNVQQDWSWEQAMRATIKDPQYRALKDPKDRKAAFEKYVVEVRIQEKEKAKERLTKLRADFGKMLRSHPEIKHYTRWKTARPIIEQEAIFRSTNDDAERRQLFEEYIVELKKANYEFEQKSRKSALDELETLLGSMDLEPYTRWADAHSKIESNERFVEDPKFKFITKLDMLTSFQSHIKTLERNFNDRRQEEKTTRARRERQNRDAFAALLNELKAAGKTKAGTKWMAVYPEFQNDSRYTNLLGQPGSTPLDMFWDVIEEEERGLRLIRNDVYDVLEDKRFEMNVKTTFAEFTDVMASDRRTASIDPDILRLIHERLLEKVHKRSEEDKHASERQKRRLVDDLRSRIKHLDNPPVTLKSTWEVVRAQVAHTEEYKALDSEDLRKQAFEKVIRRLKEKDEDLEREREKDRSKRDYRDRSRDRDRGQRNGHSERRHKGRGSRTPEPDAYEADRRKAMADREVRYRETGKIGLSPTPRDRDKHERLSSRNAEGRLGGYDRDRRDRDDHYRSRMDPKGSRDELNYGEGGASSGGRRRRGESEGGESVGSRKRPRREKTPREKEIEKEKKEEVAIHSGSEEGEMVEEEITK